MFADWYGQLGLGFLGMIWLIAMLILFVSKTVDGNGKAKEAAKDAVIRWLHKRLM